MRRPRTRVVVLTCAAALLASPAGAGEGGDVPTPTVTGPVDGMPIRLEAETLEDNGYVEQEFFLEGSARAYEPVDLRDDGRWKARPSNTAPYVSRMLVRRPERAADFNGAVVVEWFNVTGGLDASADWANLSAEIMRSGYAWAGVSAQAVGLEATKNGDPTRYASLAHPGDNYSYDIFSQAGQAIREDPKIMGGRAFDVEKLVADGKSQSAIRLTTYVNAIHPLAGVYDGFLLHSRFGSGSAIFEADDESGHVPDPSLTRTDLDEPVLIVQSETEVPSSSRARQPDGRRYRLWEVAGSAHYDEAALSQQLQIPEEELASSPPLGCPQRVNSARTHFVLNAALHHLDRWIDGGDPPPRARRLDVVRGDPPTIERDDHGNAVGGIRLPEVQVPTATLSGVPAGGPGYCRYFGSTTAFDDATLAALYPTHADYVAAVDDAVDRLERAGFILPADAEEARRAAAGSDIGR